MIFYARVRVWTIYGVNSYTVLLVLTGLGVTMVYVSHSVALKAV